MFPFDLLSPIIDKVLDYIPDPKLKAEAAQKAQEAANAHEEKIMAGFLASDQAQAAINEKEAASPNLFIAGWRPFVGWVCAFGFAWATVFQPILVFILAALHHEMVTPQIQTEVLIQALFGLLGLGGMRMMEKKWGVQNNH